MATPPVRTEIVDTYPLPSNATARTGFGKLYDYVTGLLGATGNPAEARAALGVQPTNSPTFTGTPAVPTAASGTNTTQIASTAYTLNAIQTSASIAVVGAGTVDAITGSFSPSITAMTNGMTVTVRATGANTSATPTFKADALAAKTIVKGANSPLVAGDIAGAAYWIELKFDTTLDKWVLQNPARGVNPSISGAQSGITDLTTTGNTILGDAGTDTVNIGAGGIVKDSSGNTGIGGTPGTSKLRIVKDNPTGYSDGHLELYSTAGNVILTLLASGSNAAQFKLTRGNSVLELLDSSNASIALKSLTTAKAWVNFNGTLTSPITPRSSFNVSSVTKVGTGSYTINFTTAMSDANYAATVSGDGSATGSYARNLDGARYSTTSLGVFSILAGAATDTSYTNVVIYGL